mgnify:CR=1 FL=1
MHRLSQSQACHGITDNKVVICGAKSTIAPQLSANGVTWCYCGSGLPTAFDPRFKLQSFEHCDRGESPCRIDRQQPPEPGLENQARLVKVVTTITSRSTAVKLYSDGSVLASDGGSLPWLNLSESQRFIDVAIRGQDEEKAIEEHRVLLVTADGVIVVSYLSVWCNVFVGWWKLTLVCFCQGYDAYGDNRWQRKSNL